MAHDGAGRAGRQRGRVIEAYRRYEQGSVLRKFLIHSIDLNHVGQQAVREAVR